MTDIMTFWGLKRGEKSTSSNHVEEGNEMMADSRRQLFCQAKV